MGSALRRKFRRDCRLKAERFHRGLRSILASVQHLVGRLCYRQLLAQRDRRGLMTESGGEEFHVTGSKWIRVERIQPADLSRLRPAALMVPIRIADN